MDAISAAIGILLLVFVLRGAWRGLGGELAPLAGIVAFGGTLWFGYPPLHEALADALPSLEPQAAIFYAATAICALGCTVFFVIATLLRKVVSIIFPQPFNSILGALVGACKAFVLVSVLSTLLSIAQNGFFGLRSLSEENPVTSSVAQFWKERFELVAQAAIPPGDAAEDAAKTAKPPKAKGSGDGRI